MNNKTTATVIAIAWKVSIENTIKPQITKSSGQYHLNVFSFQLRIIIFEAAIEKLKVSLSGYPIILLNRHSECVPIDSTVLLEGGEGRTVVWVEIELHNSCKILLDFKSQRIVKMVFRSVGIPSHVHSTTLISGCSSIQSSANAHSEYN